MTTVLLSQARVTKWLKIIGRLRMTSLAALVQYNAATLAHDLSLALDLGDDVGQR